jgi:hypothetical protein
MRNVMYGKPKVGEVKPVSTEEEGGNGTDPGAGSPKPPRPDAV